MSTTQVVIIVAVAAVAVVALLVAWFWSQRRRSTRLHERFGPEYEQVLGRTGDRSKAEKELQTREERVAKLNIRPLSQGERARFSEAWNSIQAQFVDDPDGATYEADRLVSEVMQTRGYPMAEFEQRAADISVDHPQVVSNYRAAHAIAGRAKNGQANTDDLREGLLHYRALFKELLESTAVERPVRTEARR
jgi:FtsZ-interacting cell division protein ZipA